MGDTCGCCSSYEQRLHEQQLDKACRPTKLTKPINYGDEKVIEPTPPQSTLRLSTNLLNEGSTTTSPKPIEAIEAIPVNRFINIQKQQCVEYLINMKVIVSVYVPKNIYDRWTLSHLTFKRINISADLHVPCYENKHDSDYKEMKCFLLKNFERVFAITTHEMNDFQRIILDAIEICDNIYFLTLNSSSTNTKFLSEIFNILIKRNNLQKETRRHGPEILDIENIPIRSDGVELICKYLEADCINTKWLKIGHCFGYDIPSSLSEKLCISFEKNTHILRINIELRWLQHSQQIDKKLKKNNENYKIQRIKKRKMTI